MITRDDIRELANFKSAEGCAVTFYYQPTTPLNKSHREEGDPGKRSDSQRAARCREKRQEWHHPC